MGIGYPKFKLVVFSMGYAIGNPQFHLALPNMHWELISHATRVIFMEYMIKLGSANDIPLSH